MEILFVNPNSTESMTGKVGDTARLILPEGVKVRARSNPDGPASIQGAEDGEKAVPGMLEVIKKETAHGVDAVVIACFDDTGIAEARALCKVPVLGIGQAAYHASMLSGCTFTVVTTLSVSIPVLEQNIEQFGVYPYCRRIRASEVPVLELEQPGSNAEERISSEIATALREDHCDAIVLGCAGMTDLAHRLELEHGVPIIDGVASAAGLAYGLALQAR
ncbi:MAG: aspartate/glutamate racemase family protein [Granulosicoccus sp.]|nr:aspartate/glutamate racemase family protein [Granulosicoccus sp.]